MRLGVALGLLPLALLAGCQSDAQRLQAARTQALEKCNSDPNIKGGLGGLDTGRFCTCLTGKIFDGRSVADIEKLDEAASNAEAQRIGMEGSAQCIAELTGAPAPAVSQPAQNAAAETVEEAVDEVE